MTKISTGATQLRVLDDGTYGVLGSVTVNAASTVAFYSHNFGGRSNVEGLFLQKTGQAVQKLAEIDNGACANAPPASGTCQYTGYANSLAISPKGPVVADVLINKWTAGNPNPQQIGSGVTLNGDIQNGQVVWPGMVINGCTVLNATTGPRSINKYGQIVILLNCVPSGPHGPKLALVVATPPVR